MKTGSVFKTVTAAQNFYQNRWLSPVYEKRIGHTLPLESIQGNVYVLFTVDTLSRQITNQVHVLVKD